MMFDEKDELLKIVSYRGLNPTVIKDVKIKMGEKIAGRVFELNKPIILNRQEQHLSPFVELLKRKELSAAISFPICSKNKVLGVLNVSQTRDNTEFSESDVEMLSVISRQAVMALENVWYMKELEETSRAKALLEQYVSPEVSEILMKSQNNLMEVGSVRELTVLFADIRKFTLLVQHLPPVRLREFLNNFFNFFTEIVFSSQGTLDKFMGDAALVIFGAPVEIDTPSFFAVTAAGKIMTEFEKLRQTWAKYDDVFEQIGLGIGISRGTMFLGNVGSSRRLDYTVIGTDVNIVQRLASETEPGKILMTESVIRDVKGKFNIQPEKRRVLRGMDSEITVYSGLR
jgi:adenylate cyclase